MALVFGTNAGFVSSAPVADPGGGSNFGTDGSARAVKHTTPVDITKITEMGWWKNNVSNSANYQLCLYSHNAGTDLPGDLLYATTQAASGVPAGWITQAVDWEVTAETIYWVCVQVDGISGSADLDYETTGGRDSIDVGISAPQDPWVSDGVDTRILAVYAMVEVGVTYSELSGTVAATSVVEAADLELITWSNLSGTIAATSTVGPSSLGSTTIGINQATAMVKRLVIAGSNQIWHEDI